ncbi:PUM [Mytilus coruscus]|uniref:PUM n=1 Tax=Mytilus coruscus TaxID=42192 RepID=A0A6J8E2K0_MYTCO|nr:PUM [Mytilus coruscus]
MNEVSWDNQSARMMNGPEMAGIRQQNFSSRSQDDATVGYFFQRPQPDAEMNSNYPGKRWAIGDDSVIEQARNVQDLERDLQNLAVGGRDMQNSAKKLWGDMGDGPKPGEPGKQMFPPGNPWMAPRDDSWGNPGNMEPGGLGVDMVEYVLSGGSPTGKELDARMRMKGPPNQFMRKFKVQQQDGTMGDGGQDKKSKTPSPFEGRDGDRSDENKENMQNIQNMQNMQNIQNIQNNGLMQNGLDEENVFRRSSRQNSPIDENKMNQMGGPNKDNDFFDNQNQFQQPGFQLDPPPFEPMGLDPGHFDYNNQMMPSMDSPNFNMDYAQLLQRQQQPIAVLTQQQYALATQQQQLGLAPNGITPTPYVLSAQDPYAVGIPLAGPTVLHPQYYGVQAPWGIYPANLIQQQGQQTPQGMSSQQQQQQQMMRNQTGRPLTPSQQNDSSQPLTPNAPISQYQILAPAYYDQNGQLVMGNPRGLGTPVRLVPPAPVLVSASGNQQGGAALGSNPLRLLTTQAQQVQTTPPVVYSSSSSSTQNSLGYTPSSSLGFTQGTSSLFTPQPSNYGNTGLNNMPSPGTIGSGQRRDSLEFKQRQHLPQLNQFYGSMTSMGSPAGPMGLVQPGQSMTPPPSLSGSSTNLALGMANGPRLYNAAPGAETRYRNGSIGSANGIFTGSSLFPNRTIANRSASMSKEVTGRSRLLEDFRNNRIPNLQLKDLTNHVVEFSQDQHGSRFIQQKLERATSQEKSMVFNEILAAAYHLMTDVFGNYVIQKFFEFGDNDQRQTLAQRLRGHVLPLALQMYGCRVIQKALETIPKDLQVEIVKELDGHVLKCVKDQNGNHVVQKCIECVKPGHLQFIIDAFKGQVLALSTHPYGCRVIQRILEHCIQEQTKPILDELHQHTDRLVQDQYGNYVIQHVLEHGAPEDKSRIVNEMRGKVVPLSQHKFASNVVEKCVSHSSRTEKAFLIEEVCSLNDGPHSALYTMMKDQFANYVVQKMIDVAEPQQRKILMHKIRPHIATLRKYTYGKHILAKLEKFFMKNNSDLGPIGMPPNGTLP